MGKTVQITCDGCGEDLTHTSNAVDYRLVLANESKPSRGGWVTSMHITPALPRDQYFCGLVCLDQWIDRRRFRNKLWREWWDAWKSEHGTKSAAGRCTSYPEPPRELRDARLAEVEAAALAEYPMKVLGREG